jgi:hypothetical protein
VPPPAEPDPALPVVTQEARPGRPDGAATGYTIVLPPGWQRIPLRQGTAEAIRKILGQVFGRLARDQPRDSLARHRIEFERQLSAMAARAREKAGLDLYLPVEYLHGAAVPASFAVSEGSPGPAEPGDPAEVVAYLAASQDDAAQVTVDGAIGIRTERIAGPDPGSDIPVGSRRVDYALSVPGRPDRWLMAVFSTLGSGDPDGQYAKILVELFDAMMSTFRWSWE